MDGPRVEVLILIVTYNGAATILKTLKAALAAEGAAGVIVVDNASTDATLCLVKSLSGSRLRILSMGRNAGLGAAFNAGLNLACKRGAKWLYILDQDSEPAPGCLHRLLQTGEDLLSRFPSVAAVSPTVRCWTFPSVIHYPLVWNGRMLVPEIRGKKTAWVEAVQADSPISSGTLYRTAALRSIGGFNASYFIDFIDHECHLRLISAGYTLWWEKNAEIYHRLGQIQRMTENGLWIEHAPFRYYYMARNMTAGYWKFGGMVSVLLLWREIYRHVLRMRAHGRYPFRCAAYLLKGCLHALLGKSGRLAAGG